MSRTITITLEDAVYQRLQEQFGEGTVESVIENFLRPYTITEAELDAEYMAMAADHEREAEASLWDAADLGVTLDNESEDWSLLKLR